MKVILLLVLLGCLNVLALNISREQCPQKKIVFCYYASWSIYRPGIGTHPVSFIDTDLCTHIIYTFAGLDEGDMVIKSLDPPLDLSENGGKGTYKKFTDLKKSNPCLKTLLAIGGWNEGSEKYSQMVGSSKLREKFVNSVVVFLNKYGFDGLDFDWEYPTQRGGIKDDRENFVQLLKQLKDKLSAEKKLLTVAVSATLGDEAYDMKSIGSIVDYVQLMTYDYQVPAVTSTTGYHTAFSNIKKSVDLWLESGFPKNKLVLGLAFHARTYELENSNEHGIGAPASGPGQSGRFTKEKGTLAYYEVLEKIDDYEVVRDDKEMVVYAYHQSQWITYDDEESIGQKVLYAIQADLAGVMMWTIDFDDFRGAYSEDDHPLLRKINDLVTR